ncbi:MAG: FAD-dependent monooxygenase, partial [Pseudomonadota bacterium]
PLAILPLTGHRSSIVWSERRADADRVMALSDDQFLDHLRPRFGDFRGQIALAGKRYSYPLGLMLTDRFIDDRVALVGDAAHAIHPIAGQGLNLGFRDVAALAEVVTDAARRGEDIGAADVLSRYQRWRRLDTVALAVATDGFNRLFSNDIGPIRAIRDLGLGVVNAMPGLKRRLIRQAAGLGGDLPRLLQGYPP